MTCFDLLGIDVAFARGVQPQVTTGFSHQGQHHMKVSIKGFAISGSNLGALGIHSAHQTGRCYWDTMICRLACLNLLNLSPRPRLTEAPRAHPTYFRIFSKYLGDQRT